LATIDYTSEYGLDETEAAWRNAAEKFAAETLAPNAQQADRDGAFSRDVVHALGDTGLIAATLPRDVGGGGASTLAGCLIAEEIGAVDGSVRGFMAVQIGLVLSPLIRHGTHAQVETWVKELLAGRAIGAYGLTEPGAGSDVGAIATTIEEDGDHVVLNGEKVWITNGGIADFVLVFGTVDPTAKTRGLECYLVPGDTPGMARDPMPGRELGHRASDHAQVRLEDVRVPKSQRVGPERGGFSVAMEALGVGRLNVAAGAVGIHRACLDACTQFARERRQFGKRIGDFQQIGAQLADMAVELRAARLLTHHAARLTDRGLDATEAVSAAKLYATEAALKASTHAIQIHGSRAYSDELPIERFHRDVIALTIYEGTSHIQRVILSRALLGRDET